VLSDRIGAVARADTDGEGSVARGVPEVVSRRGELRAHDFDKPALYKGTLNNEVDGLLRGPLTSWEGAPAGEIELHKRLENGDIIWEGNFHTPGSEAKLVRLSRSQSATSDDVDHQGQCSCYIVTKHFTGTLHYIPQDLYLHAIPKFDRLIEAVVRLKTIFPYYGQRYTRFDGEEIDSGALHGEVKIDFLKTRITKLPGIMVALKSSDLFVSVFLSQPEYGGIPQHLQFKDTLDLKSESGTVNTLSQIAKRTIAQICRAGCQKTDIFTNSDNVRVYEIVGKSMNMFLNRNNIWEKYIVSLIDVH
jgi:hypothetical protein